jgi:hypothetical protein
MKRTVLAGLALAVAAVLAVFLGDALNLGLSNPLLGVGAAGALALAPGGRKLGRLIGFLVGIVIALVGYGITAQFLPASSTGTMVQAVVVLVLVTVAALASMGRMPLWSVLLGMATYVGAYQWTFDDKPYDFLNSSVDTLGALLVTAGIGYLAAALVDMLAPEDDEVAAPEPAETDYANVGSEQ